MEEREIIELISSRANILSQLKFTKSSIDTLKDSLLPPEIKIKFAEIDEEYKPAINAAQSELEKLEKQIKAAVISHGGSVITQVTTAVYNSGKRTANLDEIDALIRRNKKYSSLLKQGDPYVTFRDKF